MGYQHASCCMGLQIAHLSPCECAGILLALAAPEVDLLGISCVNGNVVSILLQMGLPLTSRLPPEPPGQHGSILSKCSAGAAITDLEHAAAAVMMKCPKNSHSAHCQMACAGGGEGGEERGSRAASG